MDFHISWNVYQQRYHYKYLALYHALRDAIVAGKLPYGSRLPASRELAGLYEISRGIVSQVYEMLEAEGYVSAGVGSGTFVSFNRQQHAHAPGEIPSFELSAWGRRLEPLVLPGMDAARPSGIRYDFSMGQTNMAAFPYAEWNRTLYGTVRKISAHRQMEAFESQGHLPLREAIARYLRRARGIEADPEDVVIVNGSMQAIALLAQLLVNPGDTAVIEDPGYRGIRRAVDMVGGQIVPARVDENGIVPGDWQARVLFVTPSRQFPTGAVLSLERRQEILQWALRHNAVIVEDDYDSEFRYKGRPIEPLKVLDNGGRVVYVGTFSKTLFSDIRIGYVVVPAWLRTPFCKARHLYEPLATALIEQYALASFMNSGQYERHLRRMKRLYSNKQQLCFQQLQEHLGAWFDFVKSDAGLHIFGWWKDSKENYEAFRNACREKGIVWTDADVYMIRTEKIGACFGFAHLPDEEICIGIRQMASCCV